MERHRRLPTALAALPSLLLACALFPALGCDDARPAKAPAATNAAAPTPAALPTPPPVAAPATFASLFSKQRAWKHLADQVAMGSRGHGKDGYVEVQQYLRDHLAACGAERRDLAFSAKTSRDAELVPFVNIMGRFQGDSDAWILLGTHYDTRLWADVDPDPARRDEPIEGANDGGSGTAVLLEIATVLKERRPPVTVEIVFFDGEDYGRPGSKDYFIGSKIVAQRWSEIYATKPELALVLDMVGDADLEFLREANSDARFPWIADRLWRSGAEIAPLSFGSGRRPVWDDHTALMEIGIPATLLIDFDYPWWHQTGDTLDKCSPESLEITGRVVLAALLDSPLPKE